MRYSRSLDGLRGVAIVMVVLFHFGYLGAGWAGVQMFFVLSGYLITSILWRERTEHAGLFFKRFYWRRSLRIFPLYFGYLLILAAIYAIAGQPAVFGQRWGYLFTYTYNYALLLAPLRQSVAFTHFWSLAVEEQFYLVWPLLVYFVSRRRLWLIIWTVVAGAPVIRYLAVLFATSAVPQHVEPGLYAYAPLPAQCDALALGAAVALYDGRTPAARALFGAMTLIAAFAGLANLMVMNPQWTMDAGRTVAGGVLGLWKEADTLGYPPFAIGRLQHVWSYSVIDVWTALLILNLRQGAPWLDRLLANGVLVFLGRISYGLYVIHYPLLGLTKLAVFFDPLSLEGAAVFCAYVTVLVATAYASFRFIESWFLGYKDARYARPLATVQP